MNSPIVPTHLLISIPRLLLFVVISIFAGSFCLSTFADTPALTIDDTQSGPRKFSVRYDLNRGKYRLTWRPPRSDRKSITGYQIRARYNNGQWTTLVENTGTNDAYSEVKRRIYSSWGTRHYRELYLDPFAENLDDPLVESNDDSKIYVTFAVRAIRGNVLSAQSKQYTARYYDPTDPLTIKLRRVNIDGQEYVRLTWRKPPKNADSVNGYQIFRRRVLSSRSSEHYDSAWELVSEVSDLSFDDEIQSVVQVLVPVPDDDPNDGVSVTISHRLDVRLNLYKIKAIRGREVDPNNDDEVDEDSLTPLMSKKIFVGPITAAAHVLAGGGHIILPTPPTPPPLYYPTWCWRR